MRPLQSCEIKGNWATLLLPIGEDDSIDYRKLGNQIDIFIASGVSGIYSNGTAGEFYNQEEHEFDKINALLAEKCTAANMPFQVGCSHPDPRLSLSRLKRAIALRPSAVQVILPDWVAPSMSEVVSFLNVMNDAAGPLGLVLYNPPHAKRKLGPEDFYQIKEAGIMLAGCKTAGGDPAWFRSMKSLVPDISIFVPGHELATGICLGAQGAYSNVACLHPAAAQKWYELIITDIDAGLEVESRIQRFMRDHIVPYIREGGYSNQAVDKLLAVIGGWAGIDTRLRWPYKGIPAAEAEKLIAIARELLPEFFLDMNRENGEASLFGETIETK